MTPRLRFFKNKDIKYDDIINNESFQSNKHDGTFIRESDQEESNNSDSNPETLSSRTEADEERESEKKDSLDENERFSSRSSNWLSTENIISTLSDKKLESALLEYRTLTQLLETELSLRRNGHRLHIIDNQFSNSRLRIGSFRPHLQNWHEVDFRSREEKNTIKRPRNEYVALSFIRKNLKSLSLEEQENLWKEWKKICQNNTKL